MLTSSFNEHFFIDSISKSPKSGNYVWTFPSLNDTEALTSLSTDVQTVKKSPWISGNTRGLFHRMLYFNTDIQLYAYYENKAIVLDGGHKHIETNIVYFNTDVDVNINDFFVLLSLFLILLCSVYIALRRVVRSIPTAQFTRKFWFYHVLCWFVVSLLAFMRYLSYVSLVHEFNKTEMKSFELLKTLALDYDHTRNSIITLLFIILIRVSVA